MKILSLKSNLLNFIALAGFWTLSSMSLMGQSAESLTVMVRHPLPPEEARPVSHNARLNDIPAHAYRHFARNYAHVQEASWTKLSRGFQVKFQQDRTPAQANYDAQGRFLYAVRYLEAQQCDQDFITRLSREFPGYQPDIISEINNDIRTVYLVTLKNALSMKSVMFREGSFQTIDDLDYAGR